ncbi:pyridoxamine 5'-phosphate oxidase [Pararhodonellum marinum]|uniref:pyridoxamine 5'-phosphate oxidase n=1 Tax=Pararhodonellum marinum TaxID=2755358 RepID=UPI00188EEA20|nr:pyridoxamine 5'-phosphate oxidase [Pararhodonellum marinum]
MNIADIRKDYSLKSLNVEEVDPDPLQQFKIWFEQAMEAKVLEVNAMNLSTVNLQNLPESRIVLLKGVDHGFVFFTNYNSKKGKELANNPHAALNFFWGELERQVRINGKVEKISQEASEAYFFSRPFSSQIGAWTSPQSQEIPNRQFLEKEEAKWSLKFKEEPIQKPDHWGGYRVIPHFFEFWQGRPSRLHDRVVYERMGTRDDWKIKRLAP